MIASAQHYQQALSAYAFQQSTRPQTVGYLLADNPVGLAAWIYALFQDVSDSGGAPESVLGMDAILDDIMLYWLPNAGASSAPHLLGSRTRRRAADRHQPRRRPGSASSRTSRCAPRGAGSRPATTTSSTTASCPRGATSPPSNNQPPWSRRSARRSAGCADLRRPDTPRRGNRRRTVVHDAAGRPMRTRRGDGRAAGGSARTALTSLVRPRRRPRGSRAAGSRDGRAASRASGR